MAKYEPDGHTATYVKWSEDAEDSPTIPYVSPCLIVLSRRLEYQFLFQPSVASTSQATLENVLRQHIRKLGGKVETGVELIAFEQDEQKVMVHLLRRGEDGKSQEETMICEFVIGADGAKGMAFHQNAMCLLLLPIPRQVRLGSTPESTTWGRPRILSDC